MGYSPWGRKESDFTFTSLCDVSLCQRSQAIPPEQCPLPTPPMKQVSCLPFQDSTLEIISWEPGAPLKRLLHIWSSGY